MEFTDHFIRSGMYLLQTGVAKVNDESVFLIDLISIDPATVCCFIQQSSCKQVQNGVE